MKKILIILFMFASFISNGQNLKGFNVTAFDTLKTEKLLKFNSEPIIGAFTEYSMHVDTANRTVTMTNDESEIAMQLGQELWLEIKNGNGVTFENGALVYIIQGTDNGKPIVMLADNRDFETVDAVGMLTHDVEAGTFGFTAVYGNSGGHNTLGTIEGQKVYVDTTGGVKNWTTTVPSFPAYEFEIGFITKVDEFEGKIFINPKGQVDDILHNLNNANLTVPFDFRTEVVGGNIVGTLSSPTGDTTITVRWSDGFAKIVVPQSVNIPQGTSNNSQFSVVYLEKSTGLIATSTTYFPLITEIKTIAKLDTWDAAKTLLYGQKGNQNYNDYIANVSTGIGRIAQIGKWQRLQPLKFVPESGSIGSMAIQNVSGLDSVKLAITQGVWSQANEQLQPAYDMELGDDVHIWNYPDHADTTLMNLANVLIDAQGNSLAGRSWTWVFWLVQNKTGEPFHVYCNLPNGSYSSSSSAIADALGYKVKSIPYRMQSYSGFLYEAVMTHTNPGGGTWTLVQLNDIKGDYPFGGGSASSQGGVVQYLTDLLDFPNSYVGEGSKLLQVDPLESAVSFIAKSDININDFDTIGTTWSQSQVVGLGDSLDLAVNSVNSILPTSGNVNINLNNLTSHSTDSTIVSLKPFPNFELIDTTQASSYQRVHVGFAFDKLSFRPRNDDGSYMVDGFELNKDNFRFNGNIGYHEGNSNLSTVDWAAKDMNVDGIITTTGIISSDDILVDVGNKIGFPFTTGTTSYNYMTKPVSGNSPLSFFATHGPPQTAKVFDFVHGFSVQTSILSMYENGNSIFEGSIEIGTQAVLGSEVPDLDQVEALITGGTEDADFNTVTTPQLNINDANTVIAEDGSSNMTFTDAITGTKTLAELVTGTGTDLTSTHNATTVVINSSDGTNATINGATGSLAGVVTNTTQTFGGNKTFTGTLNVTGDTDFDGAMNIGNAKTLTVANYVDMNYAVLQEKGSSPTAITAKGIIYVTTTDDQPNFRQSDGSLFSFDLTSTSDFWKKKNFKLIDSPLDKILALKSYSFDWEDSYPKIAPTDSINVVLQTDTRSRESSGFIAQEAINIIPEIVSEVDESGYLQIDYDALVPYLVEAIKEQQKQIEDLQKQINELK